MNSIKRITIYIWLILNLVPITLYAETIDWKVVNRFPLFIEANDFKKIETTFKGSQTATQFLSAKFNNVKTIRSMMPINKTAWDVNAEKYDKSVLLEQKHQVEFILQGGSSSSVCSWNINKMQQKKACNEAVYADINENEPINVVVQDVNAEYKLNDEKGIEAKLIVGLGDSFASGEGNPDYPTVFYDKKSVNDEWFMSENIDVVDKSVEWWDRTCHRSLLSWQSLYALRESMVDNHRVIKFASFACSGAEIYDGFFNPQKEPPGAKITGKKKVSASQHDALMDLLCVGQLKATTKTFRPGFDMKNQSPSIPGHASQNSQQIVGPAGQAYYGEINSYAGCDGKLLKIDQILLSFGGNDFGFSGVVKWGIGVHDSKNNSGGLLKIWKGFGIKAVNIALKPISPEFASKSLVHLDNLYSDLHESLKEFNIDTSKVSVLIYPDPLPTDDFEGCRVRTRDGNLPLSLLVNKKSPTKTARWKFGLSSDDAKAIRCDFITPFRSKLLTTIAKVTKDKNGNTWKILDANLVFNQGVDSPTICSTTKSCTTKECESSNKLTWIKKLNYSYIPRINNFNEFLAYDSNRSRGLRLASDALLTQSGVTGNKLDDDWLYGIAHPTGNIHAALADKLFDTTPRE